MDIIFTLPMVRRRGGTAVLLRLAAARILLFPAFDTRDGICVNLGQWRVNMRPASSPRPAEVG